jgi:hypothetical protein
MIAIMTILPRDATAGAGGVGLLGVVVWPCTAFSFLFSSSLVSAARRCDREVDGERYALAYTKRIPHDRESSFHYLIGTDESS